MLSTEIRYARANFESKLAVLPNCYRLGLASALDGIYSAMRYIPIYIRGRYTYDVRYSRSYGMYSAFGSDDEPGALHSGEEREQLLLVLPPQVRLSRQRLELSAGMTRNERVL